MNQIFQCFLTLRLGMEEFFFLLKKCAVIPADPQQPVGIYTAEFRHLGRHILQKIAIVTYDYGGEGCSFQQSFKPFDSGEVEVIRRLIEQQNIGRLNQRLHDGETLLPASRQCRRFCFEVFKSGPAQRLAKVRVMFRVNVRRTLDCPLDYRAHGFASFEVRVLLHTAEPQALSDCDVPAVGFFGS